MSFSLHEENSLYNNNLKKHRTKPNKNNWRHKPTYPINCIIREMPEMLIEDVLMVLAEQGIEIDKRTLQRYAKEELIPQPKTISAGRNYGRIAHYAEDTPANVAALRQTLGLFKQLRKTDIAKIRKIALIKEKIFMEQVTHITGADIINLCKAEGRPKPDISEDDAFDFVDHFLHEEISALDNVPEDVKKVIDLLVSNWIIAYSAAQRLWKQNMEKENKILVDRIYKEKGFGTIGDFKKRWDEQINFIANIYSQELIDKTIKVIRSMKI